MYSLIPEFILKQHTSGLKNGSFQAAALFMDVSGFTAITEQLLTYGKEGVETISDVLQFMFDEPVKAVYAHNGFVASFLGDALTGIFITDDKTDHKETILSAIGAALSIKEVFETTFRSKFGDYKFDVKIGLSFGDVDWGILGQNVEKTYYFSGNAITNCATAENLAADGEIWCDDSFLKSGSDFFSIADARKDNFTRIQNFKKNLSIKTYPVQQLKIYSDDLLADFSGKHELYFINPELRDVSTVYLAFCNAELLNDFMDLVFEQTKIWGGSHPHLYYGDKGWNLVVFFGAPIAHGNHPDRAINFLLSLKEKLPVDFQLKGGITSGKLFAGLNGAGIRREFTCLGSKVNLACRYMVLADWNEFLCDELTAKNPNFIYENHNPISFKGNLKKIAAYRLIGSRNEKKSVFNYKFIGREEEISELKKAVTPIFQGKFGGVFYIDGPAGVGKTRLLNEFRNRLPNLFKTKSDNHPLYWLHFPCEEILCRSLHPVIYFLKNFFGVYDNHSIKQNFENFNHRFDELFDQLPRGELKEFLNNRRELLQSQLINNHSVSPNIYLSGREFFDSFIYAVKALIRGMSLLKPVIIDLEDAQWIDAETNHFLEVLTTYSSNFPLIILASCRYSEDGLKIKLKSKHAVRGRLKLKPFNNRDSFSLAENIVKNEFKTASQSAIPEPTFNRIWDISEGNPFVIEQLVSYLGENNYLNNDLTLKIQQLELPSTVNAITTARIDKLSPLLKETVKAASVLGKEFDIRILSKLVKPKSRSFSELLQEGFNESIWHPINETRYAFSHIILRDCAYQMQLNRHLKELHLKTADLLVDLHSNNPSDFFAEIAYHFETGDAINNSIRYYELAGDYSANNFRNSEALAYYNKIINHLVAWREVKIDNWQINQPNPDNLFLTELRDSLETYLRNLLKIADLMHLTGSWQDTETMYKEIITISIKINQQNYLAEGYHYLGRYYQTAANFNMAMKYYKKARRQYMENKNIQGIISILTDLGDICEKRKELKKAARYYHFQLKLAEIHQNKKGLADAYWKIGNINLYSGRLKSALSYYQKKLSLSEELNDQRGVAIALNNMALIYADQKNIEKTFETYQQQLEIVINTGDLSAISRAYCNLSQMYLMLQQTDKVESYIDKALTIDRELNIHASLMTSTLCKAEYLYLQKDYQEANKLAQECLHHARIVGDPEIIERCSRLLKKNNFMTLQNRKTKIKYLDSISEELNRESNNELKIRDYLMMLELHSSVNYKKKTIYNEFVNILNASKIKKSTFKNLISEADKLLNRN